MATFAQVNAGMEVGGGPTEVEPTDEASELRDPAVETSRAGKPHVEPKAESAESSDETDRQPDRVEVGAPLTSDDLVPDQALRRSDEDEFNHSALARRVAELVRATTTPLNIGLFGSWGSGKSSLAGLIEERLPASVAFVNYDAWKYGGHSLRRNFISKAAAELGLDKKDAKWRDFYRGLYETRRRAEFDPGPLRKLAWPVAWRFAALFAVLLVLFALGAGAASLLTNEDFAGEIERSIPPFLQASAIVAFVLAAAKVVFDTGQIQVEQSAPSADEEFSDAFRSLIEVAKQEPDPARRLVRAWRWLKHVWSWIKNGSESSDSAEPDTRSRPYERLVFFVDELDRCSEEDVVETLVAIRTFLDEEDCVFIVAADRDVLETALDRNIEQATPTNADDPYYTTAGAFLDKIFGHQIAVPPLRGRRLTRYARDLVRSKPGLWRELLEAQGSAQLDAVIYALIPANVRSPRRVKVLLNNLATNARLAEGRGIEWPDRAQEIAKLTALQAEFPALAADLILEPRLPTLLLEDDPSVSERSRELLDRHRLTDGAFDTDVEDPDTYFSGRDKSQDPHPPRKAMRKRRQEMREQHRRQLRRYLERTADVDNPQRDLLYLEAAGAAIGLEDPELGEEIEEFAPEDPDRVIASIERRGLDEQNASARLVADIIQDTVSTEQENAMTVLMSVVSDLSDDLSDEAARDVNNSLRLFSRDKDFAPQHLPGVLAVALRVGDEDSVDDLATADALWAQPGQVRDVAMMLPTLPERIRDRLVKEVARHLRADQAVLIEPVTHLDEAHATVLLETDPIKQELQAFLGDASVDKEVRHACIDRLILAALAGKPNA